MQLFCFCLGGISGISSACPPRIWSSFGISFCPFILCCLQCFSESLVSWVGISGRGFGTGANPCSRYRFQPFWRSRLSRFCRISKSGAWILGGAMFSKSMVSSHPLILRFWASPVPSQLSRLTCFLGLSAAFWPGQLLLVDSLLFLMEWFSLISKP